MNTPTNAVPQSAVDSQGVAPAATNAMRPLYWSLRRELWEYRSLYIAPLVVAALIVVGFLISTIHLPGRMRAAMALTAMQQQEMIEKPYDVAALLIMGTTLIVAIFYCLDALYGERRDRSILFWKSLPVSDLTAVLSKAIIPIVVLPLITFAVTLATHWVMFLLNTLVLLASGVGVASLWTHLSLWHMSLILFYHLLAIHGIWYAPIYGWLLLISSWARRVPFLWAALPPFAIGLLEKITLNTSHFANLMGSIIGGGTEGPDSATGSMSLDAMTRPTPGEYLSSPGLWIGLVFTAVCLALAVRMRRYREPL